MKLPKDVKQKLEKENWTMAGTDAHDGWKSAAHPTILGHEAVLPKGDHPAQKHHDQCKMG